jgi:uncharacterized membrane protein
MIKFKAVTFAGKRTAHKVLNAIEDSPTSYIWMEEGDVASISVNQKGHVKVHSTWAQDSSMVGGGIGLGALLGGLIGLFLGPAGAVAGSAVGASIGGLIGHHEYAKFDDPMLDDFSASLVNDSSALLLLGPQSAINEFTKELAALTEYEFASFETALDEAALEALKKAMKK